MVREDPQSQIDDELYSKIYNYIKIKGISIEDFAFKIGTDTYIFNKAMDRKIKMYIYDSIIKKIKAIVNAG